MGALAPVVLAAGAVIPLSATPAAADPPCAEDVYPKKTGEFTFEVTVTLNRCNRPTRAMIKCAVPFGGGVSKGNTVTTGTSKTLCSRNSVPGDTGWEVYYGGAWHPRWM